MSKNEAKKRIDALKKEINHYRYLYHVLDKQEISDAASDSLKNELFKLEMAHPDLITPDSPTQRVGGKPLAKFGKVEHSAPMISLFDAFSPEDMRDWEGRILRILNVTPPLAKGERREIAPFSKGGWGDNAPLSKGGWGEKSNTSLNYFCELKLDGLAMALIYDQGKFILGATRGDGKIGENVTQNLRTIDAIPLSLRRPAESELQGIGLDKAGIGKFWQVFDNGRLEARGEAIMAKKVFNELNEKYKKADKAQLANPRNAAAGSIRQLDPKLTAERKLDFYAYALATDLGLERHEQELELLKLIGIKVLKHNKFCRNLDDVFEFHNYWEHHKEKLPFYCDGVVVKVNALALWPRLGIVGKGPRYMMAYKFSAEQAATKVKDVVWQVGRTGMLTPTALLEPAHVGGVTISRATLHNMDEIKRLDLKIGDTVIIERAGDVIPKVVKVLPNLRIGREKEINVPRRCPQCEGPVEKIPGEVAYRCAGKNCYAVNLRRLAHWASKGAIDIEGLGPKIVGQLMDEGLVRDASDFYRLAAGDLKPLERFAEKSADNLIKAIEARKEIELPRFLYALGIRHVGEETAELLAKQITNKFQIPISEILKFYQKLTIEDLEKLEDIGPKVAESIYSWFYDSHNVAFLHKLEKNGVKIKILKIVKKDLKLTNKSFVLTGSLSSLTRDEAKAKIRELGGDVSSSVSKNTDFVVAGAEAGSKYDKAKKLGVNIVDEEEFLDMIKS